MKLDLPVRTPCLPQNPKQMTPRPLSCLSVSCLSRPRASSDPHTGLFHSRPRIAAIFSVRRPRWLMDAGLPPLTPRPPGEAPRGRPARRHRAAQLRGALSAVPVPLRDACPFAPGQAAPSGGITPHVIRRLSAALLLTLKQEFYLRFSVCPPVPGEDKWFVCLFVCLFLP